jgi:transcription antitermination factor NusG
MTQAVSIASSRAAEAGSKPRGWAAIYTRANHEKTVVHALEHNKIECYLPLYEEERKWSDRTKRISRVLFPNYVFARITSDTRSRAIKTVGVAGIVTIGGRDDLVADQDLEAIRRVLDANMNVEPISDPAPGEIVRIERGPLSGITGTYVRRGKEGRMIIRIELLRRGLSVQVEDCWIKPAKSNLSVGLQGISRALREKPRDTASFTDMAEPDSI